MVVALEFDILYKSTSEPKVLLEPNQCNAKEIISYVGIHDLKLYLSCSKWVQVGVSTVKWTTPNLCLVLSESDSNLHINFDFCGKKTIIILKKY